MTIPRHDIMHKCILINFKKCTIFDYVLIPRKVNY